MMKFILWISMGNVGNVKYLLRLVAVDLPKVQSVGAPNIPPITPHRAL